MIHTLSCDDILGCPHEGKINAVAVDACGGVDSPILDSKSVAEYFCYKLTGQMHWPHTATTTKTSRYFDMRARNFSFIWIGVVEAIWELARLSFCGRKTYHVIRLLCSDVLAECPEGARAIATASVRAPGGRLEKEAFVTALLAAKSGQSATSEDVPTLRVRLCDLFDSAGHDRFSRGRQPTVASLRRHAQEDKAPNSGVALEAWASQHFFEQLREAAPLPRKHRKQAVCRPGKEGWKHDVCESCGCYCDAGDDWSQRSFNKSQCPSRASGCQSWAESLRNPAGWHYFDFGTEPHLPLRPVGRWKSPSSTEELVDCRRSEDAEVLTSKPGSQLGSKVTPAPGMFSAPGEASRNMLA
ncbi:unnamed protein product [Symbiodinium natans]|uniref:Uncharacterized protein n=1 Tax=Symbiodinium natans TaxID=878477 RepID=A0A812GLL3_9DINO|nr:unnamed protein product [Symbiodinium natans]